MVVIKVVLSLMGVAVCLAGPPLPSYVDHAELTLEHDGLLAGHGVQGLQGLQGLHGLQGLQGLELGHGLSHGLAHDVGHIVEPAGIKYAVPETYIKEAGLTYVEKAAPAVSYAPSPVLGYAKSPVVYASAPQAVHHNVAPVVYAKAPVAPVVYASAPEVHAPVSYASPVSYAGKALDVPISSSYDLHHDVGHSAILSDGHGSILSDGHGAILSEGHGAILSGGHGAIVSGGHFLSDGHSSIVSDGHAVLASPDVYSYGGAYGGAYGKAPLSYASYGHSGHSLYDGSVAYGSSYAYPTGKSPSAKVHGYTSVVKGPHSVSYQSVHKEDVPYGYASHYGYEGHGQGLLLGAGLGHGLGVSLSHGHGLVVPSSYASYGSYGHGAHY